jgi:FtsZ-binding cell division protein ZapB
MKCGNCGALEFVEATSCCAAFEKAEIARLQAQINTLDEKNGNLCLEIRNLRRDVADRDAELAKLREHSAWLEEFSRIAVATGGDCTIRLEQALATIERIRSAPCMFASQVKDRDVTTVVTTEALAKALELEGN